MKPLVSIIVPVHNAEAFLAQCLDSVLAQTYGNYEVICADDASTDGSLVLLRSYAQRDARIQVLTDAFDGPSAARNAAMAQAKGDYIAFLDADDWWDPSLLERAIACALQEDAQIVVFDYWLFYGDRANLETYRDQELFARLDGQVVNLSSCPDLAGFVGIWDRLFRRDALVPHGFMRGMYYEDAIYCLESLLAADRIAVLADHLYYYRRNVGSSITGTEDASRKHELDFLVAQGYMQDCLQKADVPIPVWTAYARYFAEYAYMHQREVTPYGRFKAFFKEVRALAYTKGQPALFDLVGDDSNPWRSVYCAFVRSNACHLAWLEASALNGVRRLMRR